MFNKLKTRWKVGGAQLLLILCTFALGGSATGWLGKKIMDLFSIDQNWLWVLVYVLVVTLIWPFMVLLISIPLFQYTFFTGYLKKIGRRMGFGKKENNSVGATKKETQMINNL